MEYPLVATRKSTLVFCVNLAHVRELTNTFRGFGVDARYVYSGTSVTERKALISLFKEGAFPVLINCGNYLLASAILMLLTIWQLR